MPVSSRSSKSNNSANQPYFATSFIRKAHQVVKLGYDRMNAAKFSSSQEEQITGELTREMQAALEDSSAPRWCRNYWAYEEARVNDGKRTGKKRKRIDIEVIKHQSGERPKLRFEAKRLSKTHSVGAYLGTEGLGCFLDSSYAPNDAAVGMLGYVQDGDVATYAAAIEGKLKSEPKSYRIQKGENWQRAKLVKGLETFQSRHSRSKAKAVDVVHTLLAFC